MTIRASETPDTAAAYAQVAARLDRLPPTRVQRGILVKGGLSTTFDGMDNGIVSFLLPVAAGVFALSGFEQGLLGSSALIGAFAGALLVGVLGDRMGRRTLLIATMAIYSAAMLAGALSPNAVFLLVTRILAGVAIGINANIVMPYLVEFAPVRTRGKFVGSLAGFFGFGFVLAALIGFFVIPAFSGGWRVAQLIVGVPIVLAVLWRRNLPESPRYLVARGRVDEAMAELERLEDRVRKANGGALPEPEPSTVDGAAQLQRPSLLRQLGALFRPPLLRQSVLICVLWFCFSFAYYGFLVFLPTLLVHKGLSISESFGYSILVEVAQVIGYYPAAVLSERIDRKWTIVAFLGAAALSALGLALATSNAAVLVFSIAMALFLNGGYAPLYTYTPEVYPTAIRATGVGASAVLSRTGAAIAPVLLGASYASLTFFGVFVLLCCVIAVAVVAVTVLGISTRNRSLEQISA
ncbi:MFS transporter [Sciscionella sediminilitoris]|uniref:MFS transporter n=1 Tax=Sciscionella sediminilitoris TaxID=1445613 RepID=UPI00068C8138|nr:MFS transporter [Sciscionella sp. SE31]